MATEVDLYIAGTGTCLGDPETAETAIAAGRYSAADAARSRQLAATVATQAPPDLAVQAGRQALQR